MGADDDEKLVFPEGGLEAIARAIKARESGAAPDWTLVLVQARQASNGVILRWITQTAGFGEAIIYFDDGSGVWRCANERMSRDFVKEVFSKWLDSVELDDD